MQNKPSKKSKAVGDFVNKLKAISAAEDIKNARRRFKAKLPYIIIILALIIFAHNNGLTLNGNLNYILVGISFVLIFSSLVGFGGLFGVIFYLFSGGSFDWWLMGFLFGFIISWPDIVIFLLRAMKSLGFDLYSENSSKK